MTGTGGKRNLFGGKCFGLQELTDEDLLEEKDALSGLIFTGKREPEKKSFVDYYSFPEQETTLSKDNVVTFKDERIGTIHSLDFDKGIVGIKENEDSSWIFIRHILFVVILFPTRQKKKRSSALLNGLSKMESMQVAAAEQAGIFY